MGKEARRNAQNTAAQRILANKDRTAFMVFPTTDMQLEFNDFLKRQRQVLNLVVELSDTLVELDENDPVSLAKAQPAIERFQVGIVLTYPNYQQLLADRETIGQVNSITEDIYAAKDSEVVTETKDLNEVSTNVPMTRDQKNMMAKLIMDKVQDITMLLAKGGIMMQQLRDMKSAPAHIKKPNDLEDNLEVLTQGRAALADSMQECLVMARLLGVKVDNVDTAQLLDENTVAVAVAVPN